MSAARALRELADVDAARERERQTSSSSDVERLARLAIDRSVLSSYALTPPRNSDARVAGRLRVADQAAEQGIVQPSRVRDAFIREAAADQPAGLFVLESRRRELRGDDEAVRCNDVDAGAEARRDAADPFAEIRTADVASSTGWIDDESDAADADVTPARSRGGAKTSIGEAEQRAEELGRHPLSYATRSRRLELMREDARAGGVDERDRQRARAGFGLEQAEELQARLGGRFGGRSPARR